MDDLSDYLDMYAEEAEQHLTALRSSLTALKSGDNEQEALNAARLAAHSLKGISLTMHFNEPARLAANLEDYLYQSIENRALISIPIIDAAILSLQSAISAVLEHNKMTS